MSPASDQPVAVVTGATGGIGRELALKLALAGRRLVLVGRDRGRGEAAVAWIGARAPGAALELEIVDLSSVAATADLGRALAARHPQISLLVNNAGVFETKPTRTPEGFDRVLATNLLSPFVLTRELLPALRAGAPSRIVNVGSSTSDTARLDPEGLVLGRRWNMVRAYGQSKLALLMVTVALARRLEGSGVVANCVHPGTVATGLVREGGVIGLAWRLIGRTSLTAEQGADTPAHVALSPAFATISGAYVKQRAVVPPNRAARDPALTERVWRAVERLTA